MYHHILRLLLKQELLSQSDSLNPLAVHSIGLGDVYLDIKGNVQPLFLSLDSSKGQYQVVDSKGLSKAHWSRLAISPKDIARVFYAGKRIILDLDKVNPDFYDKAFFVEMLSPDAAEALLRQLGEKFALDIAPKSP